MFEDVKVIFFNVNKKFIITYYNQKLIITIIEKKNPHYLQLIHFGNDSHGSFSSRLLPNEQSFLATHKIQTENSYCLDFGFHHVHTSSNFICRDRY